jgi:hypothetical protein
MANDTQPQPFKFHSKTRNSDGSVTVEYSASFWNGGVDDEPQGRRSHRMKSTRFRNGRWNGVSRSVSYFAELEKAAANA